jgi:DnaK suppressor protein
VLLLVGILIVTLRDQLPSASRRKAAEPKWRESMVKTMKKAFANGRPQDNQSKLQARAQMLKDHMSTTSAAVVAYQEMPGDDGDRSQQSEQEWLFLSQNRAHTRELGLIEKALQRIKAGRYGICLICAEAISPRRLEAIPWAECCIECQDGRRGMSVAA